ncbi:hypothetical protein BC938DRAFT_482964 [Jimgerdemannia flammicorona]|uniref:Uncharacterized protein n=1 Tax=Jimgerdemannia flammicorona TaxID=994334 RepID=A0A433QCW2_9FUNG|nr:hypothetical protein BC938DRAFT_482964 [Jimgerdemannia flammicorona]
MHASNPSSPMSPTTVGTRPGEKSKSRKNSKDKEPAVDPGDPPSQLPPPPSTPRVVIDQSIVTALIDHAYSDSRSTVLGYLGGKMMNDDALEREDAFVHISQFLASERSVPSMLTDMVTEMDGSLEHALDVFREAGLNCLTPSRADTLKQLRLQSKTPYCVGIVVSASITPRPSILSNDYSYNELSQQIAAFRAVEASTAIESPGDVTEMRDNTKRVRMFRATRVVFGVNQQLYTEPHVLRQMALTLTTTLNETRQAYAAQLMDCNDRPSRRMFVDSEYENFLMHFWRENVVQMKKSVDQDFLSLAVSKHDVKRLVSDRMDSIIGAWRKQILKKAAKQDNGKTVNIKEEDMRRRLEELVKKLVKYEEIGCDGLREEKDVCAVI